MFLLRRKSLAPSSSSSPGVDGSPAFLEKRELRSLDQGMLNLEELLLRVMRCIRDSFGVDVDVGTPSEGVDDTAWSRESCDSPMDTAVVMECVSLDKRDAEGEESNSALVSESRSLDFSISFPLSGFSPGVLSPFVLFLVSLRLKRRVVKEGAAGFNFGVAAR